MRRALTRGIDPAVLAVATLLLAAAFLHAHWTHPMAPQVPAAGNNWFGWYDQGRYLEAALAWTRGDLSVPHHLYMPGYPLLAVPFLLEVPALGLPLADPFLPANLLSLLASLWLLASIAARLAPGLRHAGALGAAAFLAAVAGSPKVLAIWVEPWSTSPATPLILLCLWASLRFHAGPPAARWSFVCGLAGAALVAFRPTDTIVALGPAVLLIAWTLVRGRAGLLTWMRTALAGAAGVVLAIGVLAAFYVPIYGWAESPYMIGSARTGFEWRLLPLRWVMLMLDPRPLLPDGRGLISAFPWLLSGLAAAFVLVLLPNRAGRAAHAAVGGAVAFHTALYLCYRDLHSGGLWLYHNYHYFKWVLPVCSIYTVLWLASVIVERQRRWTRLALGCAALCALLPWRPELRTVRDAAAAPHWDAEGRLVIPQGLPHLDDAVVFAARGSWDDMFMGRSRLSFPSGAHAFNSDYKTVPAGGGLMLTPLRPLPEAPQILEVRPPSLAVDRNVTPVAVRQAIVFGLPCLLHIRTAPCVPDEVLAPAALPLGAELRFGGPEEAILRSGWSAAEPSGRWTQGSHAVLRFSAPVADLGGKALVLELLAIPFLGGGTGEGRTRVVANDRVVAEWTVPDGAPTRVQAVIPAELLGEDGAVILRLELRDTKRFPNGIPGWPHRRRPGLLVQALVARAE